MQRVESGIVVSVSDLKRNPTAIMSEAQGEPVAVLNHNRVMAYMVPPRTYEAMLERLDDLDLIEIVKSRAGEKGVRSSLMTYNLEFLPSAKKEWDRLGATVKTQFVKKLKERLEAPRIPSAALHGMRDCYKIKLRRAGYRLVYRVEDLKVTIVVVAVGKRERNKVYETARRR